MEDNTLSKRILEEELNYLRNNEPFLARFAHKGPKSPFTKQIINRQGNPNPPHTRVVVPRDSNSNLRLAYYSFI